MSEADSLRAGVAWLEERGIGACALGLVLGSGLRDLAGGVRKELEIGFAEVPQWPCPRVSGHAATLVVGELEGIRVACLGGRVHLYEDWSAHEVVRAVRCLRLLGTRRFLLTNAAGGIAEWLRPGDLMVIRDHINLTGASPLVGDGDPLLGPRFPDQSAVYTPSLRAQLRRIDPEIAEGVYACTLGPGYETPAEIRMMAAMHADAVGMSTVPEAVALNAMGAEVAAVSLISNLAAGRAAAPLRHEEVLAAGRAAAGRMARLVRGFCAALREERH
jgi:purine-nucleoside phosphorylase